MKSVSRTVVVAVILLVTSCQTIVEQQSRTGIKPPITGADVALQTFMLNPDSAFSFRYKTGSKIRIPAGCFESLQGGALSRPVAVSYRELHDMAEVILSGIPMRYDSAGQVNHFLTAGMFEIQASCAGEPVRVKAGQQIAVDFATFKQGNQYNQYYWDTVQNNWLFIKTDAPRENTDLTAALANLQREKQQLVKPQMPQPYQPDAYTFDINVSYDEFAELSSLSGIMWQYAGNDKASDPKVQTWVQHEKWGSVKILPHQEEGKYKLTLISLKKEFNTVIKPVYRGRALKQAKEQFRKKMAAFTAGMERKAMREQQLAANGKFVRTFQVSGLGTYNCDYFSSRPSARLALKADFGSEHNGVADMVELIQVFEGNGIIRYAPKDGVYRITYGTEAASTNNFLAILPDTRVAYITQQQFLALCGKAGKGDKEAVVQPFNVSKFKVNSPNDLKKVIAML